MAKASDRRQFLRQTLGAAAYPWLVSANSLLVVRRPYVQKVRSNRATVRWTTGAQGEAAVQVIAPDRTTRTVRAISTEFTPEQTGLSATYYRHAAVLEDLQAGTEYSYRVLVNGEDLTPGDDFAFRTAGSKSCNFLAIGDSGTGSAEQEQLARLLRGERPSPALLVHTGDLVYPSGTIPAYERKYFDFYHATMSRVPFFPCLGNHDYYEQGGEPYRLIHDLPTESVLERDHGRYYSFDWGDIHFIALDSNSPLEEASRGRGQMLKWFEDDLAGTRKFWRVVFFHHPPYATGPNETDTLSRLARAWIAPILERHGVPLVFNGHEHSYQRTKPLRGGQPVEGGTVYVTTGGGGATLYPTNPATWLAARVSAYHYIRAELSGRGMKLVVVGIDGQPFDSFTVTPPPVIAGRIGNPASGSAIGRGGLMTVPGYQFSPETLSAEGGALSSEATDVRVTVGDSEAQLVMVSPTHLNVVVPRHLTGSQTLRVTTPGGSHQAQVEILAVAPAIFSGALFKDGQIQITDESPCPAGSRVSAFVTGMAVLEEGASVLLGGTRLDAVVEPSSELPGVQLVWFELPGATPAGAHSLTVEASGIRSNTVSLPVRTQVD